MKQIQNSNFVSSKHRKFSVLALSSLFPNAAQPAHGIFLQHRLAHLSKRPEIDLRVIAPVPWFPFSHPRFGRYSEYGRVPTASVLGGLQVRYPRFPVIPKVGAPLAATAMALAAFGELQALRRAGFVFDVIDSYYLYPDGVAAALLGLWFDVPVVLTALGSDVSQLPQFPMLRKQIVWALRRASGVTAVCNALKDAMGELARCADNVEVVLHGVDLELFQPTPDRGAAKSKLGLASPTLLSVGHLIPRKGHDVAIEALRLLSEAHLLIVGEGPLEADLIKQAEDMRVGNRVRFIGRLSQPELAALMAAVDALVLCSDREGIANVLLESMACGTPVVATPVWGTPQLLDAAPGCVLTADRSPEAIAAGVRKVLSAPVDDGALRRYAERYTWAATARRHDAILRAAIARYRASLPANGERAWNLSP